jgi:DNA-binding helix-hairpin-helix protein with protein kinase domain
MSTLKSGTRLTSRSGLSLTVSKSLGEGGQGTVYAVQTDAGRKYALKWYHRPNPQNLAGFEEQRAALIGGLEGAPALVDRTPPDRRFLWPQDYVEKELSDQLGSYRGYGYLMDLRTSDYAAIEDLVLGRVRFTSSQGGPFRTLCTAAIGIADCFRALHLQGLCYKDINYGGPFFNPRTGDVLICDNDNVRVDKTPGIIYFPEFAAPEINRGEADCTTRTDEHALAVLLFFMFCRGNPLEGRREINTYVFEDRAKRRTFGEDPVFVFDPKDDRNRPVEGIQSTLINNWRRLPRSIQDAFTQVFTEGLKTPNRRMNDTQWVKAFSKLRDSLYPCSSCGLEGFYDRQLIQSGSQTLTCSFCGHQDPVPPRIRIKDTDTVVLLTPRTRLYPYHMGQTHDFSQPVAEMAQHPRDPTKWGLRNLGKRNWIYRDEDGSGKDVPPGKSLVLRHKRVIDFGQVEGLLYT